MITTGVRLTKAGEALLAKVHMGDDKLEITNFVLGDAVWTAEEIEAGERTSLKNVRASAPVTQITTGTGADAGRLIAEGVIDNTYVTEAFYTREIGLMANDPDLGEILYLIDPVAAEAPTTVVESNATHQEIPFRMELIAVSRDQVELVLSQSVAYVTSSQFGEALDGIISLLADKSDTGHKHTVSDVTDFPNSLPASDVSAWAKQPSKPTYTPNEVGAAPTSHKHKVSDMTDFPASMPASDVSAWAKAANKPTYTPSEVGAAPTSHNHTKNQITDLPDIPVQYTELITASKTWTTPYTGMYKITLVGGGGGGGSGGTTSSDKNGGGGGSGGAFQFIFIADTIQAISLVIGAGGEGGRPPQPGGIGRNGTSGGDSYFGTLSAGGGDYGRGGTRVTDAGTSGVGGTPLGNPGNGRIGGKNPLLYNYGYGGNGTIINNTLEYAENGGDGCVLIEYLGGNL